MFQININLKNCFLSLGYKYFVGLRLRQEVSIYAAFQGISRNVVPLMVPISQGYQPNPWSKIPACMSAARQFDRHACYE